MNARHAGGKAGREHYQSELECRACGKLCLATWEENENRAYARIGFRRKLVLLSGDFRKAAHSNTIVCDGCDLAVLSWE